jgi:hypothetical protein
MFISVTKPCGEHVMEVHLHGVESRLFQLEKEEDIEGEGCSQEKRIEASWFGIAAAEVKRRVEKRVFRIKNDNEEEEEEEEEEKEVEEEKRRRFCLELGIDICLNFPNFVFGFASLGFATSASLSFCLKHISCLL